MDLTRAAIEKNRITAVALLLVLAGGLSAYGGMSRAEDPGFTIRAAQVLTRFPGASPERIEQLVTDPIEEAIQELPEIDFISSTSKTGVSIVMVNVRDEFDDMRPIWDDLRRKVERVAPDLPAGVIGPQVNDEFGDVFGIVVTLTGDGYSYAELKTVADEVRDELLRVPDVAKVDIYGAQDERIFVDYDNARLAELGLSPQQLRSILDSANIIIPGGSIRTGVERVALEPTGNFESVADLRRTVVTLPGRPEIVFLEDLAAISRGYADPPSSRVYASGVPALALGIAMRDGGNMITLGEGVTRELERLQAVYPIGIDFDVVAFQPESVERKVREFMVNLGQAVAIVLAVMLLFLGPRTGLVVASLVPMAMIASLLVMAFFDIGLDQMSLAALIIALGMLVDNAIVMAESIMVRMAAGRRRVEAAVGSARELRVPLLISSLTTAAAFLPISLAQSTTGEYTAPLFKVITIALLSSWLLALTMTPLLSVLFLRVRPVAAGERFAGRFYRAYRGLLIGCLRRPALTLVGIVGIFLLAMQGFRIIPNIFFPPSDKAIFTAEYELPAGTSIERTLEVVETVDRFVAAELRAGAGAASEGVTNWATFAGNGGPRFYLAHNPSPANPQLAFSLLNATSRSVVTDELIPRIAAFCRERFPELDVTLNPLQLGPPVSAPVQVRLSGRDPDRLFDLVDAVKARLQADSRRHDHHRRLGHAQQEAGRRRRSAARPAGRGDEPGRRHLAADRAQRVRDDAVPRGRDHHPRDAPLDAGEPHRRDEARQPERLRPGDRRGGAAAAGRRRLGGLGAVDHPPPRPAQDGHRLVRARAGYGRLRRGGAPAALARRRTGRLDAGLSLRIRRGGGDLRTGQPVHRRAVAGGRADHPAAARPAVQLDPADRHHPA